MNKPLIAALDQKQWIQLSDEVEAYSCPAQYLALLGAVETGQLIIPLHAANLYETFKIDDAKVRERRANTQLSLSRGLFFASGTTQRRVQVGQVFRDYFSLKNYCELPHWAIGSSFWLAFSDDWSVIEQILSIRGLREWSQKNPAASTMSYIMDIEDDFRRQSVRSYSEAAKQLVDRICARRDHYANESRSLKRKALSVHMWMDNQDLFWKVAKSLRISDTDFRNAADSFKRKLITDVPALYIERELTLRLDAEGLEPTENDARDIQYLYGTIPVAGVVVGEVPFISRAKQANLDTCFDTVLTTEISQLLKILDQNR